MDLKFKTSADGSHTLYDPDLDETYHSVHGAIQEAKHVFIKYGLNALPESMKCINIFEMGFGTGLNTFITQMESDNQNRKIMYHAIETLPLEAEVWRQLNYTELLQCSDAQKMIFETMHQCPWNKATRISKNFELQKIETSLEHMPQINDIQLIYYDAFGPRVQPDLWTQSVFQKMFNMLSHNGILVTYSAKGSVKRAMKNVGFAVEALPGPPGKREMTRAIKR